MIILSFMLSHKVNIFSLDIFIDVLSPEVNSNFTFGDFSFVIPIK